ncbi:MAG TPA: adenylate/guanylate cyclase domain-containing protein [Candidatus Saccharimonadales bacterium]|nr:adenylate/guanylate cyclase domain-containing protein [Candidatus Saccharimonadales bacterium]
MNSISNKHYNVNSDETINERKSNGFNEYSDKQSMMQTKFNEAKFYTYNRDHNDLWASFRMETRVGNHEGQQQKDEKKIEDARLDDISIKKFFDPTIYEMLLNPQEHKLRNDKLVIVFWDISGFATLCNRLNNYPFIIVDLLKNAFSEAERIILKNNGIIDKFIGDGIMAFFGYHQTKENQMALDAIITALEFRENFKIIKNQLSERLIKEHLNDFEFDISLKCGIHIGDVLIGLLETEYRNQITLIGSNVNFANRLEGKAENDQIIVSENVLQLVKDSFDYQPLEQDIYSYGKVKVFNILSKK